MTASGGDGPTTSGSTGTDTSGTTGSSTDGSGSGSSESGTDSSDTTGTGTAADDGGETDPLPCVMGVPHDATNETLWERATPYAPASMDTIYDVALDGAGNVFVTGQVGPAQGLGTWDIWVQKYSPDGEPGWSRTFNENNSLDAGRGIAIDSNGDVIVVGDVAAIMFVNNIGIWQRDVWVGKLDGDTGATIWTYVHQIDELWAEAHDVALTGAGEVIVVGFEDTAGELRNLWLAKHGANGGPVLWQRSLDIAGDDDLGAAVTIAPSGDIVTVGRSRTSGIFEALVAKHDGQGNHVWSSTHSGQAGKGARANSVAADACGNLHVGGAEIVDGRWAIWVARYDADGTLQWTDTVAAPEGHASVHALAVDPDGSVLVAGSIDSGPSLDVWARRYSEGGEVLWTHTHDGMAGLSDEALGVALAPDGGVVLAGYEQAPLDDIEIGNPWLRRSTP